MDLLHDIGAFIEQTLTRWQAPGAAVGVIRDNEIILAQGFGLRDVANQLPVSANTLFPIASCTKAFTAMTVGLLVDEGLLEWDKPVKSYLPDFQMYDPFSTERLTVRDMLCHRSGLIRHDLMWYAAHHNRQQIYNRLRYLQPKYDLRSTYEYNNIMFILAGYLVEKRAGVCWEQFLQQRILTPLGMRATNASTQLTQLSIDFAQPYLKRDGVVRQIPFYESTPEDNSLGSAGAMQSSITDLLKWMRLHLNNGQLEGMPFISEASLRHMHSPQIAKPMTEFERYLNIDMASYGLGWGVDIRRCERVVRHYGEIDGFSSIVALAPEHRIGVTVLVNLNGAIAEDIIAFTILDRLLGKEPIDYNERWDSIIAERKAATPSSPPPCQANTQLSHALEAYTGEYENPAYGIMTVQAEDGKLYANLNARYPFQAEHFHYDIFAAQDPLFDNSSKLAFLIGWDGEISGFNWQLDPTGDGLPFRRVK